MLGKAGVGSILRCLVVAQDELALSHLGALRGTSAAGEQGGGKE
jgi:hypothetical protein